MWLFNAMFLKHEILSYYYSRCFLSIQILEDHNKVRILHQTSVSTVARITATTVPITVILKCLITEQALPISYTGHYYCIGYIHLILIAYYCIFSLLLYLPR